MSSIPNYPWHRVYCWGWQTRIVTAWLILSGQCTMQRAWQEGYDQRIREDDFRRALGLPERAAPWGGQKT